MSIKWQKLLEKAPVQPLENEIFKIVESQEQAATSTLVDHLGDLETLNQLIDNTKPKVEVLKKQPHYLILTPFRYPPLLHGSRFGKKTEPSLFYGSHNRETVLAEAAYYRFLFWSGMTRPPEHAYITQHSIFSVNYSIQKGVQLQSEPFCDMRKVLTHSSSYQETQTLGSKMRGANIEGFEFISARDESAGINVALFSPAAFPPRQSQRLKSKQELMCETTGGDVVFSLENGKRTVVFKPEQVKFTG
ncbi:MAG TPA: RES domain-containing protein [Cycloclasticus sp.]|nr:RES domain-containing protein [Cycloclasticus sp.]HIL92865.1 RES domain-containing protein [Cycloclasticus sp.]